MTGLLVARSLRGDMQANGISPAGYGFRVNRADGTPILDHLGPIGSGVMSSLGVTDVTNLTFTSTSFSDLAGSAINFSLARQGNIPADFLCTGKVSAAGNVGFILAVIVGVTTSGNLNFGVVANGAQTSSGWLFVSGLPAGSYTAKLQGAINGRRHHLYRDRGRTAGVAAWELI
jgi:hypothetical protein